MTISLKLLFLRFKGHGRHFSIDLISNSKRGARGIKIYRCSVTQARVTTYTMVYVVEIQLQMCESLEKEVIILTENFIFVSSRCVRLLAFYHPNTFVITLKHFCAIFQVPL